MPAPLMMPVVLMGVAALGVAAVESSSKKRPKGGGRTYTLDSNLPPALRDQVLAALTNENNPDTLEAFATAIASSYPLSAAALRTKATGKRVANPPPTPTPSADPLAVIPEPARSQIAQQLAAQTDPSALEAYATQLDPIYPQAATLLRVRAMQLRAAAAHATTAPPIAGPIPTVPTLPTPPPIVAAPTSLPTPLPLPLPPPIAAPSSAPTETPTPYFGGLDPGMPPDVQKAVAGALTAENDPAKLEGFASAIQAQYPVAAGLLVGKAAALRAHSAIGAAPPLPGAATHPTPPPIVSPTILTPVSTPTAPSPAVPMTVSPYLIGDDRTRTGRNAGRPGGFPFVLIRPTDATYPAKIAKDATGYEGNYGDMTSLNPHLAPGGKWINLVAGDALNVPWAWAQALARTYQVQTDPGVTPSTSPVPSASPPLLTTSTASPTSPASSSTPFIPASTTTPTSSSAPVTYTVKAGDSPSRIAGNLVHDQGRWRELVAANPSKRTGADGNFASLNPGEILALPASWAPPPSGAATPTAPIGAAHGYA